VEEVCGDIAIYVDPHDAADIARGIKQALEEPDQQRQAAIEAGLDRAGKYSWARTASELEALITPLLLARRNAETRTPKLLPRSGPRSSIRTADAEW
jgi:trehalose-6-phosphate synthase